MALIVETGAIVPHANSLVSRADLIAYAASVGVVLTNDVATDVLAVKAMAFINSLESTLKGSKVNRDQSVAYPRAGVEVDGWSWSESEVPRPAILLQCSVVLDMFAGADPYNPQPAKVTKREKIDGAVEVEYFGPANQKLSVQSQTLALVASLQRKRGIYSVQMVRT